MKKVEVSYEPGADEDERLKQVAHILSDGLWAYLKRRGLLKEGSGRVERAADLPQEAHGARIQPGEIPGEDS